MRDLKDAPERVTDHRSPIAIRGVEWRFQAHRSGNECSSISAVRVVDIDIEKGGEQLPFAGRRHHDERVANADFGWAVGMDLASGVKHGAQEGNRGRNVTDDNTRRHGVEPARRRTRYVIHA